MNRLLIYTSPVPVPSERALMMHSVEMILFQKKTTEEILHVSHNQDVTGVKVWQCHLLCLGLYYITLCMSLFWSSHIFWSNSNIKKKMFLTKHTMMSMKKYILTLWREDVSLNRAHEHQQFWAKAEERSCYTSLRFENKLQSKQDPREACQSWQI